MLEQAQRNQQFVLENAKFLADQQNKQNDQAIQLAKMQQEGQMFGAGLQERRDLQQMAQEHQTGLLDAQGRQQMAQARLQSELHGRLQEAQANRQMTWADQQRMHELDQGIATVRTMHRNGELGRTPMENDMRLLDYEEMYQQESNPLQALVQRTQIQRFNQQMDLEQRRSQAQQQLMTAQAGANDALADHRRDRAAQNGPRGAFPMPDPANPGQNLDGLFQYDQHGVIIPVEGTGMGAAGGGGSGHRGSGRGSRGGRGASGGGDQDMLGHIQAAEDALDDLLKLGPQGTVPDGRPPLNDPLRTDAARQEEWIRERANRRARLVGDMASEHGGEPHPHAVPVIRQIERDASEIEGLIRNSPATAINAQGQFDPFAAAAQVPQRVNDQLELARIRRRMVNIMGRHPRMDLAPQADRERMQEMARQLLEIRRRYAPTPPPGFEQAPMPSQGPAPVMTQNEGHPSVPVVPMQ